MRPFRRMSLFSRMLLLSLFIGTGPVICATIVSHASTKWTVEDMRKALGFTLMLSTVVTLILVPLAIESVLRGYQTLLHAQRRFMFGDLDHRIDMTGDPDTLQLFRGFNTMAEFAAKAHKKALSSARDAAIFRTTQMLAHDIRRPFSRVKILTLRLGQARDISETQKMLVETNKDLDEMIDRVNGMLDDILLFGSQRKISLAPCDPQEILQKSLLEVSGAYGANLIRTEVTCPPGTLILGDKQRLQRVFTNILENAFQAMNGTGLVQIRVTPSSRDENQVHISVVNSGPAIDVQLASRIFEPFVTHGKQNGTGLGLAIAKHIVDAHGGTIRCVPFSGQGPEFKVTVKGCPTEVAYAASQKPSAKSGVI